MKKTLIALAVAGTCAATAAQADSSNVTVYGAARLSVDQVSSSDCGAAASCAHKPNFGRVSSNASRIGFKGTEDLGNGLSAVFQIEEQVGMDVAGTSGATNTATANSNLSSRNTFVGLSGKTWGTVLMGIHDTPYKLATGSLDIFADTLADYNSIIGTNSSAAASSQFDRRTNNTVAYITPTFSGFHAAVGYVFGENPTNDPKGAGVVDQQGKAWSAAGIYENGPLFASLAWEKHTNLNDFLIRNTANTGDTDTATGTKLGAGYSFGDTKIGLVWEKLKADQSGAGVVGHVDANRYERSAWHLNLAHTMGANTFKIAYTKANKGSCSYADGTACNTDGLGAKQWALGVDHAMSKRTSVYALYTKISNEYDQTQGQGGVYDLGVNGVGGLADGSDPKAISVGINHSF